MLCLPTYLQNTVFLYLDGSRQYRECVPLNYGIFEGVRIQAGEEEMVQVLLLFANKKAKNLSKKLSDSRGRNVGASNIILQVREV